jgi:HEPN domain-containing protein
MMTKEQHIEYWVDIATDDWSRKELLYNANDYVFCLYLAHLTLEKLAKANWVKTHQDNIPPKVHNIVYLLEQSDIDFGDDMMRFLKEFNDFQLSGRYPDYTKNIYKVCTKEFTDDKLEKIQEVKTCLLKMLQ